MAVIRTPDARFADLPDYPFAPRYLDLARVLDQQGEVRMHYLDEGEGEVVLCLHGEPSWSFLYRRMIPILARRARVLAPDLIGFGKSDKFTERSDYSYKMHRDALVGFLDALDLQKITLVCQDWGGLLGLQIAGQLPDRFSRLVIMNTALPTGDIPMGDGFKAWREFAASTPDLPIGTIFGRSISDESRRTPEILAGYEAPFPDASYKAGAAQFPLLVPIAPDDPRRRREPRGLEDPRAMAEALPRPVGPQRPSPQHEGRRAIPGADSERRPAGDHRGRWTLPAGRPRGTHRGARRSVS